MWQSSIGGGFGKDGKAVFFLAVDTVLYAAGVAAIVLVLIGAVTGSSELNPDESESIYSVQYYIGHLMPPGRENAESGRLLGFWYSPAYRIKSVLYFCGSDCPPLYL